jgi:hypothetical protein
MAAIAIDPDTGDIRIGDSVVLTPRQAFATIEAVVANWLTGSSDMGNGYAWLHLKGLTFGGHDAGLALCFHDGRFEQASWNVDLSGATQEEGWPTREAIDEEIAFVRRILAADMGLKTGGMPWGEIWSSFDAKGFLASNGLRYRPE